MNKPVTLKDMALELGVSVSTVSKALNNDATIGHHTRERVERLARARHYVPNEVARNFQQRRRQTIGLLVPNVLDQFFVQAINGVDRVADEHRYSVLVSQTLDEEQRADALLDSLRLDGVDGLITTITPATDMTAYRRLAAAGIPVVFMARSPNDPACAQVRVLNSDGARQATDFLVGRGHRRLAYLNGPPNIYASQQRRAGFEQALTKTRQQAVHGTVYQPTGLNPADTEAAMADLMAQPDYPTGIVTFKTYMALDAMTYLKRTYPDRLAQVEFVGFGNLPLLKHLPRRPAASIEENPGRMGEESMCLLMQLMSDTPPATIHVDVPGELIVHAASVNG